MNHLVIVQIFETQQNLSRIKGHDIFVHGKVFVVTFKGAIGAIFEEHAQIVVFSLSAQIFDYILVIQLFEQLDLSLQGRDLGVLLFRILAQVEERDTLHGNLTTSFALVTLIDVPKRAMPNLFSQLKAKLL